MLKLKVNQCNQCKNLVWSPVNTIFLCPYEQQTYRTMTKVSSCKKCRKKKKEENMKNICGHKERKRLEALQDLTVLRFGSDCMLLMDCTKI